MVTPTVVVVVVAQPLRKARQRRARMGMTKSERRMANFRRGLRDGVTRAIRQCDKEGGA